MGCSINECEACFIDYKKVDRITKGLERYAKQAAELNLTVFGASGSGQLRSHEIGGQAVIVGSMCGGVFDGGDGGTHFDENGLERGET